MSKEKFYSLSKNRKKVYQSIFLRVLVLRYLERIMKYYFLRNEKR